MSSCNDAIAWIPSVSGDGIAIYRSRRQQQQQYCYHGRQKRVERSQRVRLNNCSIIDLGANRIH
jgi:hypothetical protein